MALVIGGVLALRAPHDRARLVAIATPAALLVAGWLAWFAWLWGTPSPTAPYGTAHQMALWHLAAGVPGLFFDQEYGIAAVAPVLAMAGVGWWVLWRRDAAGRRLVTETVLPLLTLALTVGAYQMWWGGSAPPGRQVVAALPLLGVPLAALWHDLTAQTARRAILVVLLGVTIATTGTFVFAREGLLIGNHRDGASELLAYLASGDALGRFLPSFTADRLALTRPFAVLLVWAGVLTTFWWLAGRARWWLPGRAGLAAIVAGATAVGIAGAAMSAADGTSARAGVATRVQSAGTRCLRRHRPPGRDCLRPVAHGPPDVGAADDPVRGHAGRSARSPATACAVEHAARPAHGLLRVAVTPLPGHALTGEVGLQVGRSGPPQQTWTVDVAGRRDVDAGRSRSISTRISSACAPTSDSKRRSRGSW